MRTIYSVCIIWILTIILGCGLSGCARYDLLDRYLDQPQREGPACFIREVAIDSLACSYQPSPAESDYFRRYLGASLVDQSIFGRAGFDDPTGFRYAISSTVTDYHIRTGWLRHIFRGSTGYSTVAVHVELVDRKSGETIYRKAFQSIETQKDDTPREIMASLATEIATDLKKSGTIQ